ncbi:MULTISPECIES: ribonuclease Z [Pedobacter]|uniref:Ribonuclease Z n=1 Tax=Pedobacter heparinus (strain ATCC 13125 / DSM 2366 / CIP 104194 / JCM 7457 / NBRC 12017 / NCIMB 9290 / NRRL B-14731 / HIM 762-3) TaxID=485917 RepID=C6XVZ5_PEDHD|nr:MULTISPECIES: ribonuclease Z [Pedobacter]ACU04074.1 beta-lactamase domain protein [Pedobacter heparinus DSM 2366]MBB5436473.1 ribonuclease Z [Pedobacter sp. AK017]
MKFEVTILGSSSATPVYNRNPTAQLLNCNEKFYLIDCGEGTQQQLIRFGFKANKIDFVFISHLHGDHYFGLIGLLSSLHLNGRIKPIKIFAPAALAEILELQFKHSETVIRYPVEFVATQTDAPAEIFENADLKVETIILNHRIPCTGFKFVQKKRLRKLIVEKLEAEEIPVDCYPLLKRGADLDLPDGRVLLNADYTTDSDRPKQYCYCSDTLFDETYFESIQGCDTLYHEATFLHEMVDRANQTHHTTALQAAEIAKMTGAAKLLIGHFSSRYKTLQPLLEEARSVFENTELAIEGNTYTI